MTVAPPDWDTDGAGWPNRAASRFVETGGVRWHVQQSGGGPVLLLLHGTGASSHSWRDLLPMLAHDFAVVAPDLPGHAFTRAPDPDALSLPGMARAVAGLLAALGVAPDYVAGHSAGAAVLARLCLDRAIAPRALVSLNGAFLPPRGAAGQLFSPIARTIAKIPAIPSLFAWRAGNPEVMQRLLRATGSTIDAPGAALYTRLGRIPAHVQGALTMMARWDLAPLVHDLPRLRTPLVQIVGSRDRTIPPEQAATIRALVPGSRIVTLAGLGHLAHEERPDLVAAELRAVVAETVPSHA